MIKIGDKVKAIDDQSEFFGLTVNVTDIRTEPKPHPFQVYLCKTTDGTSPEDYPFSSQLFRKEQILLKGK